MSNFVMHQFILFGQRPTWKKFPITVRIGKLLLSTPISILCFVFRFTEHGFLFRKRLHAGGCGRKL